MRRLLRMKSLHALLTVAMLLGGAELLLRRRAVDRHGSAGVGESNLYQSDPIFGRILRPNSAVAGETGSLHVNALGFRGGPIARDKPPGTLRVAVIGDSVVFGRYADDRTVWTAQLQRILTDRLGRPVEVINAGVPGYTMATAVEVLRRRVLELSPDAVVVCQFMGDLNAAARGADAPAEHSARPLTDVGVRLARWRDRNLLSYHLLRKNLTPRLAPLDADAGRADAVADDFAAPYAAHLAELIDSARRSGAAVLVVTPWRAIGPDQQRSEQLAVASAALMNKPTLSLEGLHDAFDKLASAARQTAEARGAIVIDSAEAIPADPALFADLVHFSAAGHAVAAEAFAQPIAEALEGRDGF